MTRLDRTNAVHHVYRCFDVAGRLIYVGSSANLFGRLEQHRRTSWWADQTVHVVAKVYPNGVVARNHERHAIRTEAPRWNKAGRWVTRHQWTRDQWDDWMVLLVRRNEFPSDMRRFVNLYARKWGEEPAVDLVAEVMAAELRFEQQREELIARMVRQRAELEEIQRLDELTARRDRKAAKARRLAKAVRKAERARAGEDA